MVSVVVCAYNRGHLLPALICNLSGQAPPPGHDVEIIVVDNNSSDDTPEIVARAAQSCRYPVRLALETNQGLSYTRNRGFTEARGEWIIFVDDDSVPDPDWLRNLVAGMETLGCLAGGGPIRAVWPESTPRWVARTGPYRVKPLFCHTDRGSESFVYPPGKWDGAGPNLIFHRSLPRELLYFNTDLGTTGTRGLTGGEECELFERLVASGVRIGYITDAAVEHPVDPRRFRLRFALSYAFRCGRSNAVLEERLGTAPKCSRGMALQFEVRRCLGEALRAALHGSLPGLFWSALQLSSALGEFSERGALRRVQARAVAGQARQST